MTLLLLVLPVFLVILLGAVLRWRFIKDAGFWNHLSQLTYWVLFPAFLFYKTSQVQIGHPGIIDFSIALLAGFLAAVALAWIWGRVSGIASAALTSVIQGAGRHNTFIPLAVSAQLFGASGAATGTVATAVLVPFSNVVMVFMMSVLLGQNKKSLSAILLDTARNPVIMSMSAGFLVNVLGMSGDPVLYELTGQLGQAALPIVLLCIGAGLQFSGMSRQLMPVLMACTGKMLIFPLVTWSVAYLAGLPEEFIVIAVLFAIAPTSTAGYPLAKQMGGDAPLIASIISVQTLLAVLAVPVAVVLLGYQL
ncbi:AEC family transporter [Oceanospirillum sediminis]|uniref:AEC family transporter n=1 Tax=Oceanospirillum sediminis TaxID=2760088 RepID=A0A839IT53_9GAMM|nr:AEC family transporter [Oceanospirillum sediminis]MBB1487659.1 AEC family transporter [Oceanospirillum sediminis]